MTKYGYLILFFAFLSPSSSIVMGQDGTSINTASPSETSIIWNGFAHRWTYNHRMNRLGSFASMDYQEPWIAHSSATGTGADSTYFTSRYSLIDSKDVSFQNGKATIELVGKEGMLINGKISVEVPATSDNFSDQKVTALLNGFDIVSIRRADKIQLLKIDIGDPYYENHHTTVKFDIDIALVADCQSMECSKFNQSSSYKIDVYYVVVQGGESFNFHSKDFSENYSWDRKFGAGKNPQIRLINGIGDDYFDTAALGIKSIHLLLNQAHWLVQWNHGLSPMKYSSSEGRYYFSLDLLFKEWEPGMKKYSATPKQSKFSLRKRGWVYMNIGITLMQFQNTNVTTDNHKGALFWPGKNLDAKSTDLSLYKYLISLPK